MPTWIWLTFQDSTSPTMEQLLFFHDHSIIILVLITIITIYLIIRLILSKSIDKFTMEGQEIETIWTIIPAIFLLFIALPSLKILYLIEDTKSPRITVKVTGHQWYWSYEYRTFINKEIECFIENSNSYRLLKTSEILFVPVLSTTRALVSSIDVIHRWSIPSIGIKVDALPGRLNQTFMTSKRLGLFSGQCSEICGTNHSFIPIIVQSIRPTQFIRKLKTI
jgi:cytochrome c oxidase subunit 2